ncbi:hypothetical protein [Desulfurobacterium sp. TC5-1]|uniref:hypothetical protein n=1 Tax=Desulfurobacterium sp. TC5-1 TaxID=1158318 RepID=UPI0003B35B25|nr:hypothetical protein [Desulfurobacterium sp. TC5-1]
MRLLNFLLLIFLSLVFASCGGSPDSAVYPFAERFGVGIPPGGNDFYGVNGTVVWVELENYILNKTGEIDYYRTNVRDYNETAFEHLQREISDVRYLVYWVTKDWNSEWINTSLLQEAMDGGKIPVFMFWYFGDSLDVMPTQSDIDAYYAKVNQLKDFLSKLRGIKLVAVEPEFNKGVVETHQSEFAGIFEKAIDILKSVPDTYCGLILTDTGSRSGVYPKCGYATCSLGDKYEWSRFDDLIYQLKDKIDFIGFQEMLSQFTRDPENPSAVKVYNYDTLGLKDIRRRIINFADFLYGKWQKPVMLGYTTVATGTWNDTNGNGTIDDGEYDPQGWNSVAEEVYLQIFGNKTELFNHHIFMEGLMAVFDNPHHDLNGYQFFLNNEYHIGIVISNTTDGSFDSHIDGDISFKVDLDSIFH